MSALQYPFPIPYTSRYPTFCLSKPIRKLLLINKPLITIALQVLGKSCKSQLKKLNELRINVFNYCQ